MEMKVPSFSLTKQNEMLYDEIMEALGGLIKSGQFIMGPDLVKLEEEIGSRCKSKYAYGVSSGTDALQLALLAAGIGPGDEVITTPFTFVATATSILHVGAMPVFCDIDPKTFNIDADQIEGLITDRTKAIIPVHLYGQMADMDKIMNVAKKHNLVVIEDAAQALGATYKSEPACSFGDLACLSFYPTKNLGAFGEAGMVLTSNEKYAQSVKLLRVHGVSNRYFHDMLGYNSRMDTMQAAILNVKLKYFDSWTEKRRQIAKLYDTLLGDLPEVTIPYKDENAGHIYHQYTIRVKKRDVVYRELSLMGISTMIYYPLPLHLQPIMQHLGYKKGDFPETEKAANEVLSLPMFPELTEEQVKLVADELKKVLAGLR